MFESSKDTYTISFNRERFARGDIVDIVVPNLKGEKTYTGFIEDFGEVGLAIPKDFCVALRIPFESVIYIKATHIRSIKIHKVEIGDEKENGD